MTQKKKGKSGSFLGALFGAFVGLFAGPYGAYQGLLLGATVGALFSDSTADPGPRLQDLENNDSSYGVVVPRLYGTDALTANIIWMQDNKLIEEAERVVVSKVLFSKTYQTQYKYFASFAVALCEGEIDGVTKIWANDELIYENDLRTADAKTIFQKATPGAPPVRVTTQGFGRITIVPRILPGVENGSIRLYNGTDNQMQDPLILSVEGPNTSAFRGLAYVVFDRMLLTTERFGNRIPTLRFEVKRDSRRFIVALENEAEAGQAIEKFSSGEIKTFASEYTPISTDGTASGAKTTVIRANYRARGSIFYEVGVDLLDSTPANSSEGLHAQTDNYTLEQGLLHSFVTARFRPTTFIYQYRFSGGTTVTYLNQVRHPHLFQVHDLVNLDPLASLQHNPPNSLDMENGTKLIREQVAFLHPFDMQDSFTNMNPPIVRPVQNLPGWVIVARGVTLQVGYIRGGRYVLFNTRLNLNEAFEQGLSPCAVNFFHTGNSFIDRGYALLHAVAVGGFIYVYKQESRTTSNSNALNSSYFPGIIRLDVSGLSSLRYGLWPAKELPANSTLSLGALSYIKNTTQKTLIVDMPSAARTLPSSAVRWDKSIVLSSIAFDSEVAKLYGYFLPSATIPINSYRPITFWVTGTAPLEQEPGKLYEITENFSIVDTGKYISLARFNNIARSRPRCGLIYAGKYLNVGDTIYHIAEDQEDLWYVQSGRRGYLTRGLAYPAGHLDNPNLVAGVFNYNTNHSRDITKSVTQRINDSDIVTPCLLEDFSSKDGERLNLYTTSTYQVTGGSILETWLLKQVTLIDKDAANTLGVTPFNVATGSTTAVSEVMTINDMLKQEVLRTGKLSLKDIDFNGLNVMIRGVSIKDRGTIKDTLSTLQKGYLFDVIEKDYQIFSEMRRDKLIRRLIPSSELGAGEEGSTTAECTITTPRRGEVPSRYYISYRSPELDYAVDNVLWQDPSSKGEITLDTKLPLALSSQEAYDLIRRMALSTISARLGTVEFTTSFKHSDLDLGDYITIQLSGGVNYTIRITDLSKGRPGIVRVSGIIDTPLNYTYSKDGVGLIPLAGELSRQITSPLVFDSLPFTPQQDGIGYWVGAYTLSDETSFTSIMSVFDANDNSLSVGEVLPNLVPVAYCNGILPPATTEGAFDYRHTLTITPVSFRDGFATLTEAEVLNNETSNTYWYGSGSSWELIKILNFQQNVDGTLTASGILRGYKGTTHHSNHGVRDQLIGANTGALARSLFDKNLVGSFINFVIQDPSGIENGTTSKTLDFGSRLPMPPINLSGFKRSDGQFFIKWTRQARHTIEWIDGYDVELDEQAEQYIVYRLDNPSNGQILDTTTVTGTNSAILPDTGATITVAVAQYSQELETYGFVSQIVTI